MKRVRIFISSPSDVAEERERARQVVQGLRRRYAQHFELIVLTWEDMPLSVATSFQNGIDTVLSSDQGIDIAVFILWSRLGSPLGAGVRRADGREYRSGTERELEMMLAAREAQGGARPQVLAYTRQDEASFEELLRGKNTEEKSELLRQKGLVEDFIREEFHDARSGTNVRAYHTFPRPQIFAERLRVHLQEILDRMCVGGSVRPAWDIDAKGPPFRGLEAFGFEHAEIFFGREDEVSEARMRLGDAARRGTAFLLIGGASGTGKSSLAAAGLIPEIVADDTDGSVGKWLNATFTPAALGGNPSAGMARVLVNAIPTLSDVGDEATLANALARNPELAVKLVLAHAFKAAAKSIAGGSVRLVLLVDQMEELFTDSRLAEEERVAFATILSALATSGCVWVVATIRADWYPKLLECPALVSLKSAGAQLDLVPPQIDAVRRMIESPAMLAGLSYERDGAGSLADRIVRDVANRAELLPLMEDLLRELFERRTEAGVLTLEAYESVGGIEGALAQRAEVSFMSLPVDAQLALPHVLRQLIGTGGGTELAPVRRRALLTDFQPGSPSRVLVDRLVADRLATAMATEDGDGEVSLAHEAISRVWPRAAAWLRENAEFLRVRDRLVIRMNEGAGLSESDPLTASARSLLAAQRDLLDPTLVDYLGQQLKAIDHERRRRDKASRMERGIYIYMACILLFGAVMAYIFSGLERERDRILEESDRARAIAAEALIEAGRPDLAREHLELLLDSQDQRSAAFSGPHEMGSRAGAMDLLLRVALSQGSATKLMVAMDNQRRAVATLRAERFDASVIAAMAERELAAAGLVAMLSGGKMKDIRAELEEALEFARARAGHSPENMGLRHDVAVVHFYLGLVLERTGDRAAARTHLDDALTILETIALQPGADLAKDQAAALAPTVLLVRGSIEVSASDFNGARTCFERALAAVGSGGALASGMCAQVVVAGSHLHLGVISEAAGDRHAALAHFEEVLDVAESLHIQVGGISLFSVVTAQCHIHLGEIAWSAADFAAARSHFETACAIGERMAEQAPGSLDCLDWQNILSRCHFGLAGVAESSGDAATAATHYQKSLEAVEIAELAVGRGPQTEWLQAELQECLGRVSPVGQLPK